MAEIACFPGTDVPVMSYLAYRAPDLAAHYWVVAGAPDGQHREDIRETATRVYSSAAGAYLPVTDDAYRAWLAAGNAPTPIDTEANLAAVLDGLGLPFDLRGRAAAARFRCETGGITVGNAPIATDRESQALITGAWAASQINPGLTVQFKTAAGFVPVSADQVRAIASAVAAHVQACFAKEAEVVAGIAAGTVKVAADVDAAFAALSA